MIKTRSLELARKHKKVLAGLGIVSVLFLVSLLSQFVYDRMIGFALGYDDSEYGNCNVMGIELRGDLHTYVPLDSYGEKMEGYEDSSTSEEVLFRLDEAEYYEHILGTIIEVDSYGGMSAAAEEIAAAIRQASKPVIAFIRGAGVSAGYLAIAPSDYIYALKSSDVGSIGVTMSYVENVNRNLQEGLSYVQLSAGKYKDLGSLDRRLTQEERALVMRDLDIIHQNFIKSVAEDREIAIEKVREFADGSTVLGERAVELGLIDGIGSYADAVALMEEVTGEYVGVCW